MTAATREFVPVFDLDRVPEEIANSTRAVVWNLEERDGKPTKVPYVSRRPAERASVNDPTTWGTFSEARAAVEDGKADGVGIVLGDGLIGIDIDDCRDPETGAITPAARAIVDIVGSYTEIRPSGCGVHILVRGLPPPTGRRKGNIEMYDGGRYFAAA
jgi:primase-polymerase (primpol)-like protein